MVVCSGSNADYKSSEPLKTLVMLRYVKRCWISSLKNLLWQMTAPQNLVLSKTATSIGIHRHSLKEASMHNCIYQVYYTNRSVCQNTHAYQYICIIYIYIYIIYAWGNTCMHLSIGPCTRAKYAIRYIQINKVQMLGIINKSSRFLIYKLTRFM